MKVVDINAPADQILEGYLKGVSDMIVTTMRVHARHRYRSFIRGVLEVACRRVEYDLYMQSTDAVWENVSFGLGFRWYAAR